MGVDLSPKLMRCSRYESGQRCFPVRGALVLQYAVDRCTGLVLMLADSIEAGGN